MRLLLVDVEGLGLDFCLRCKEAGHDVRWFRIDAEKSRDGEGFGIETVEDWHDSMDWAKAGLILNTGNHKFLSELDDYRDEGYPVFGPSKASAALEIKRSLGMDLLNKVGVDLPPYKMFDSLEAAAQYARKSDDATVFKTMGDEADKSLAYVSKSPADMAGWIEQKIRKGMKLKGPCMLQEKIDMLCDYGLGGFMGPEGFLKDRWEISFEHKKLMDHETGPNTGEQGTITQRVEKDPLADILLALEPHLVKLGHIGDFSIGVGIDKKGKAWPFEFTCYDDQTEVLTKQGWKFFRDVSPGEMLATLDPTTEALEYRTATGIISKDYVGEMIHFVGEHGATDLCVTPDHQMWGRAKGEDWKFFRADAVLEKGHRYSPTGARGLMQIKRNADWSGIDQPVFTLPGRTENHFLGRSKTIHAIDHPPIDMPMEVWMRFLGLYIAEGSLGGGKKGVRYIVNIAQMPHNHHKVAPLLDGFPIPYTVNKNGSFQFASRQLTEYIENLELGLAVDKRVPREFMELAPRYLSALLDGLMAGDGSTHKRTGQRTYATTSIQLADDVQEIMLKLGWVGRIRKMCMAGTLMTVNGNTYTRRYDQYVVSERRGKIFGWLDRRLTKRVRYSGKVYCADVPPHHLLFVRRNGMPVWCGNCRLGYPAWFLQIASIQGDPLQWMKDLVDGKDSLKVSTDVCSGVVCAQPPYPSEKFKPEECEGEIISGYEGVRDQLHPCAVMLETGPVMDGDKVVDKPTWQTTGPYVLVATGLGASVKAAQKSVYSAVDEVHFSDMMFRHDIGDKVIENLPELHRHGYALAMSADAPAKKSAPVKPVAAPRGIRAGMMLATR